MQLTVDTVEEPSKNKFWNKFKSFASSSHTLNKIVKLVLKLFDFIEKAFKTNLGPIAPLKKGFKSFKELYSAAKIIDKTKFWVCSEDPNDPLKHKPAWLNTGTTGYKIAGKVFSFVASIMTTIKFLDGNLLNLGKIASKLSKIPVIGFIFTCPLKIVKKIIKFCSNALRVVDEQLTAFREREKIKLANKKIAKWQDRMNATEQEIADLYRNKIASMQHLIDLDKQFFEANLRHKMVETVHVDRFASKKHIEAYAIADDFYNTHFDSVLNRLLEQKEDLHYLKENYQKHLFTVPETPTTTFLDRTFEDLSKDNTLMTPKAGSQESILTPTPTPFPDTVLMDPELSYMPAMLDKITESIQTPFPMEEALIEGPKYNEEFSTFKEKLVEIVKEISAINSVNSVRSRDKEISPEAKEQIERANQILQESIKEVSEGLNLLDSVEPDQTDLTVDNLEASVQVIEEKGDRRIKRWERLAKSPHRVKGIAQRKIHKWQKFQDVAKAKQDLAMVNTGQRVMKMAHALFIVIGFFTGFVGLPFVLIGIAMSFAIRGFGLFKHFWKQKKFPHGI